MRGTLIPLSGLLPLVSYALDFKGLLNLLQTNVIAPFIPIAVLLALLAFIWGVIKYITAGGDPQRRAEGTKFILWGTLALFVLISVWGIIAILASTFGIPLGDSTVPFPNIPL